MLLLDTSGSMGDCIDELRTRGGSRLPRKRLHHRLRRRGGAPHRLLPRRRRCAHIPAGRRVPGGCHAGQGEFDNQTSFLHPGDENGRKLHAVMMDAEGVTGLAATSDGPEYLMFELPGMTPGPIFNQMFTDLHSGNFPRQSSLDYLTGSRWSRDPRGNDDRSLAIIATLEK